ncbi:MAG TPA: hypothetical protein VES95_10460 [Dermatophilaceae bacterium]|nr:hypothetical protein [Dermatophilaceae bacterium]
MPTPSTREHPASQPPAPGASSAGTLDPGTLDAAVASLARDVLMDAAPEELPGFDAHAADYLAGRRPEDAGIGDGVGFGVEVVALLSPFAVAAARVALQVVLDAVKESATAEARTAVGAWLHRLLHRDRAPAGPEPLSADVLARVKAATRDVCLQMGAEPDDAALVSEAVTGRLATA